MVTSWLCVPNCSCHAVTVYVPGGSPANVNRPASSLTAECEVVSTAKYPCINGRTLHLTGMNSGFSHWVWIGGAPLGCNLFHSAFTRASGCMLCEWGSSL